MKKRPGCLGYIGDYATQFIRIPINQPVQWKVRPGFLHGLRLLQIKPFLRGFLGWGLWNSRTWIYCRNRWKTRSESKVLRRTTRTFNRPLDRESFGPVDSSGIDSEIFIYIDESVLYQCIRVHWVFFVHTCVISFVHSFIYAIFTLMHLCIHAFTYHGFMHSCI